jgi:hypothetical protein
MVTGTRRAAGLASMVAMGLAMGACTFPEVPIDPGPPQMVVHAVLDPSHYGQVIQVGFTDGSYQNGVFPAITATVTTPDGVVMTADNTGRFEPNAYGVTLTPGATYTLRVTSSAGHVVTGTTTIPNAEAVSLTPPFEPFIRSTDTLRMSASAVEGAASFELNVNTRFSSQSSYSNAVYHAFSNGTVTLAGTARSPLEDERLFLVGGWTVVVLCAVDVNYYEYYRVLSDPFAGAAPSRLAGGLGVFGSVVPVIVRRVDVR